MAETGKPNSLTIRKPILTVKQQIEHLRGKGVTFNLCSEEEAARILSEQDHYFRLATYRTLFPKHIGGKQDGLYAGLDFGHLVDLVTIDWELRNFLLPMTLKIENSAKTRLVRRIGETPGEDGYSILADYLASLSHGDRNRRKGEINRLENDVYLGQLATKYAVEEMPAWVFLELSSFGSFADFYLFCANRWSDSRMKDEHYMLRRTNSLRNATAHSSAIVNGLGESPERPIRYPSAIASSLESIGISRRLRRSKMRNPRVLQMTVLAYTYMRFVPEEKRGRSIEQFQLFKSRAERHCDWYNNNTAIVSTYKYLSRIFEAWL